MIGVITQAHRSMFQGRTSKKQASSTWRNVTRAVEEKRETAWTQTTERWKFSKEDNWKIITAKVYDWCLVRYKETNKQTTGINCYLRPEKRMDQIWTLHIKQNDYLAGPTQMLRNNTTKGWPSVRKIDWTWKEPMVIQMTYLLNMEISLVWNKAWQLFNQTTPFILLARVQVKQGCVGDYLELARETDAAVEKSEPGMIHHTFDQDPNDPLSFVWSEVYANDEAFKEHVSNAPVQKYLEKHAELGDGFSIEVYGTVGDECRKLMESFGLPLKIFNTKLGYSRVWLKDLNR